MDSKAKRQAVAAAASLSQKQKQLSQRTTHFRAQVGWQPVRITGGDSRAVCAAGRPHAQPAFTAVS
jgi:hypothetical protein